MVPAALRWVSLILLAGPTALAAAPACSAGGQPGGASSEPADAGSEAAAPIHPPPLERCADPACPCRPCCGTFSEKVETELCSRSGSVTRIAYPGCEARVYVEYTAEYYRTYTVVDDRVAGCVVPSEHGFYSGYPADGTGFPIVAVLPDACVEGEAAECLLCSAEFDVGASPGPNLAPCN